MEQTIKINDIEYISKEEHQKKMGELIQAEADKKAPEKTKALRFNDHQTIKLISAISKIFSIQSESVTEEFMLSKDLIVLDPCNVCGIVGKTEQAKRLLAMFYSYEIKSKDNPDLNHETEKGEICKTKLSMDYTIKIMNVLKISEDGYYITNKKDYPAIFENKDFKFVLAPRVESCD